MSTTTGEELPSFYDPVNAARWSYDPDPASVADGARSFRRERGIRPRGDDRFRTHLLLIDLQKDFCFPQGSLYVGGRSGRGAVEDNARIAEFVYRNLGRITDVTCTMDTHFPHQIFFSSFWLDGNGDVPAPHTQIATEEIRSGKYRPNPSISSWLSGGDYAWLARQADFYCSRLEQSGKYKLYLWPPHCLLGSAGHALAGVIQEARLFHAYARGAEGAIELKGGNALTENYSALAPEVLERHDGSPLARRNAALVDRLLGADAVIIAGQAASHCVKSTIEDLLGEISARDPLLARKVYVMSDCMSAVVVPDPARPGSFLADFTGAAEAALQAFSDAGMHVVRSTDPISSWPMGQCRSG